MIFVPHRERDRWERACHDDVEHHNERVVAVVEDGGDYQRWADAQAMIDDGRADVIVVARQDHIPRQLDHVRVVADDGRRPRPRVIE